MEGIGYLYELCRELPRCGPGSNEHTRKAYEAIPQVPQESKILDIGCGSGMQTLELARISRGEVTAIDNHLGFLDILNKKAEKEGLQDKITTRNMDMLKMPFENESFDIIWSEGALYFLGFQNGLKRCQELLKKGGFLAVTELVYLTDEPPEPVKEYIAGEYPDIKTIQDNLDLIENVGFELVTHFTLPETAWTEPYFLPMEEAIPRLSKKYQNNQLALDIFNAFQYEIDFYKQYSAYYGYEFFVAKRP